MSHEGCSGSGLVAWILCFFCSCPVSSCFTLCCWVPKNKHNPAPVVHYVAHNPQHQGPQVAGASGEAYNQDGHVQQQQPVGGYAPPPLVYDKTVPSEF